MMECVTRTGGASDALGLNKSRVDVCGSLLMNLKQLQERNRRFPIQSLAIVSIKTRALCVFALQDCRGRRKSCAKPKECDSSVGARGEIEDNCFGATVACCSIIMGAGRAEAAQADFRGRELARRLASGRSLIGMCWLGWQHMPNEPAPRPGVV